VSTNNWWILWTTSQGLIPNNTRHGVSIALESPLAESVRPRQSKPRLPLPDHLPRDERIYVPEATACPDCEGSFKPLGEDVSEQLEYIPASFRVIRHIRPKLACSCCDVIVQAPAPSRPIERGLAGAGLLAHVLVAKFADHIPLHRQTVQYAREGVTLERSLLANWVGAASHLLHPTLTVCVRNQPSE
jgi:transposase